MVFFFFCLFLGWGVLLSGLVESTSSHRLCTAFCAMTKIYHHPPLHLLHHPRSCPHKQFQSQFKTYSLNTSTSNHNHNTNPNPNPDTNPKPSKPPSPKHDTSTNKPQPQLNRANTEMDTPSCCLCLHTLTLSRWFRMLRIHQVRRRTEGVQDDRSSMPDSRKEGKEGKEDRGRCD